MIPRFPIVSLLSVLLAMSTVSCTPIVLNNGQLDVRDLNLSQEVVDYLPKDQALSFLQSIDQDDQRFNTYCRFKEDGVIRWRLRDRQFLLGKHPYTSFVAEIGGHFENPSYTSFVAGIGSHLENIENTFSVPATTVRKEPGIGLGVIVLNLIRSEADEADLEFWCLIAAEANANQQGKKVKPFMAKIVTALLSMGVRVPSFRGPAGYRGDPVRARKPTSQ